MFHYRCVDEGGTFHEGVTEVSSEEEARQRLESKGWQVLKLAPVKRAPRASKSRKKSRSQKKKGVKERIQAASARIPRPVLAECTRQLGLLLGSGVAITRALQMMVSHEDQRVAHVFDRVCQMVSEGRYLSVSLSNFPETFSQVYLGVVKIGESTGQLHSALMTLSDWLVEEDRISRQVRGALMYPTVVLATTFVFTLVLFVFVLPSFLDFFKDLGGDLPGITKFIMALTRLAVSPVFWLVACLVGVETFRTVQRAWNHDEGRRGLFAMVLLTPGVGSLMHTTSCARYASALALTLRFGVDILNAVRLAARASGNPLMVYDSHAIYARLSEGEYLSDCFAENPEVYPPTFAHMASAGEESGNLEEMLEKLGHFYHDEVQMRIEALSALVEPILMALVALIVGGIVLAVYLPLYGTLEQLGM